MAKELPSLAELAIYVKAKELDKKFDDGEDISKYLDKAKARRPAQEQKTVNIDSAAKLVEHIAAKSKGQVRG